MTEIDGKITENHGVKSDFVRYGVGKCVENVEGK
jgi:hypothetical protein